MAIIEGLTKYVRLSVGLRNLREADDKITPGPQERLRERKRTERPRKNKKTSRLIKND